MQLFTTRFGSIPIDSDDVLRFPSGIVGFEDLDRWVLLGDSENEAVAWLQSVARPDVAVPVVSPRRFAPGYRVRVPRGELAPLEMAAPDQAFVLVVVATDGLRLTINLRAPIIINLDRRLGRQATTSDEQPLDHYVADLPVSLRKSA